MTICWKEPGRIGPQAKPVILDPQSLEKELSDCDTLVLSVVQVPLIIVGCVLSNAIEFNHGGTARHVLAAHFSKRKRKTFTAVAKFAQKVFARKWKLRQTAADGYNPPV